MDWRTIFVAVVATLAIQAFIMPAPVRADAASANVCYDTDGRAAGAGS